MIDIFIFTKVIVKLFKLEKKIKNKIVKSIYLLGIIPIILTISLGVKEIVPKPLIISKCSICAVLFII